MTSLWNVNALYLITSKTHVKIYWYVS